MDPCSRARTSPSCRFPRTRGDGPGSYSVTFARTRFPPHARGWTVYRAHVDCVYGVSPARAGMDPVTPGPHRIRRCFPRTRGDGPQAAAQQEIAEVFPPHARGWTFFRVFTDARGPVSPARAGMDPGATGSTGVKRRFPRTRGDGPSSPGIRTSRSRFPPHARGWTRYAEILENLRQVSPARAGMDLERCHVSPRSHRFPRTRGDGPLTVYAAELPVEGFPRTRGDGPLAGADTYLTGMFPPHARGWTLFVPSRSGRIDVSPARAGMDPMAKRVVGKVVGFPRTRGDGPVRGTAAQVLEAFPPHARGWTLFFPTRHVVVSVSPARAGMDPGTCCRVGSSSGFPRTRGDGPGGRMTLEDKPAFPPHARGWTDRGRAGNSALRVSPARAGMDPTHIPHRGSGACFIALAGIEPDQAVVRDLDTLDQRPPRRILAVLHNRVAKWCLSLTFSTSSKRVAY